MFKLIFFVYLMGRQKEGLKPFTRDDLHNRALILEMLQAEDNLFMSELGQEHLTHHGGLYSLEVNRVLQREILAQYGFQSDDESLSNYRSIIHVYYRSPTDYDHEVMNSVVYLRENRLLYYKTTKPQQGEPFVDVEILSLDGKDKVKLSQLIMDSTKPRMLVAAFSTS